MFANTKNLLPFFILCVSVHCKNDATHEIQNSEGHMIIHQPHQHLEHHIRNSVSIKFFLHTPDNETTEITPDTLLLNMIHPTKIIIHGIKGYRNQEWIDQMVKNYHSKGDYNLVTVDWSKISTRGTFYAVSAIDDVGAKVGEFIMEIIENNVEYLNDIHLIGSSVGAHVGGAAGKKIEQTTEKKVGRITAFDPDDADLEILDEDGAEFVDVIHSSTLVDERSYGTVDFYVNIDDPAKIICVNDSCASVPAHDLYVLTILEADRFEAVSCKNSTLYMEKLCNNNTKVPMGEAVPRNISGSFYVSTMSTDSAPSSNFSTHNILSLSGALILLYVMKL